MSQPLLTIMMPALSTRPWEKMLDEVRLQANPFGETVEILHDVDDGRVTSGVKRQRLMEKARGEYVAFVDDDDQLNPNYMSRLVEGCGKDADVVSFNMKFSRPDRQRSEVWKLGLQTQNHRPLGMMVVNHLCAWKREIAVQVAWCPLVGYGDDMLWCKPLLASGLVKTEWHVDLVLYNYLFDPTTTTNQQADRSAFTRNYVGPGLECYWTESGEIVVQSKRLAIRGKVMVRDRHNRETIYRESELNHFYTITM